MQQHVKVKQTDSLDIMGVTNRIESIVNYEEGHDITKKDHKINVTPKTKNTTTIYNETKNSSKKKKQKIEKKSIYRQACKTKQLHIHNIDGFDIYAAKVKE